MAGLRQGAFGPEVVRRDGGYLMLYTALKAAPGLYAAASDDGRRWRPIADGPVLVPGPAGALDAALVGHPSAVAAGGRLRVWYTGYRREPGGVRGLRLGVGLAEWAAAAW